MEDIVFGTEEEGGNVTRCEHGVYRVRWVGTILCVTDSRELAEQVVVAAELALLREPGMELRELSTRALLVLRSTARGRA